MNKSYSPSLQQNCPLFNSSDISNNEQLSFPPTEIKLPENQINPSPCRCESSEVRAIPSASIHWAEWQCVGCGKHRGWIEHPDTVSRRDRENLLIDSLLASNQVKGWDATFLRTLREKRKRSPRQREILEQALKLVGGAA